VGENIALMKYELRSPNQELVIQISLQTMNGSEGVPVYEVKVKERSLLLPSTLGLMLEQRRTGARPRLLRGLLLRLRERSGGRRLELDFRAWRVMITGDQPGDLLERNDMILNLNEPCAIEDLRWIKPGKLLRDMTLSNEGGRDCVDFAAKLGFHYVMLDGGWYGNPEDDLSDVPSL